MAQRLTTTYHHISSYFRAVQPAGVKWWDGPTVLRNSSRSKYSHLFEIISSRYYIFCLTEVKQVFLMEILTFRMNKPAGASAMTWSSTYILLVLLILPKNNLTCIDWMTGSWTLSKGVLMCIAAQNSYACADLRFGFLRLSTIKKCPHMLRSDTRELR